MYLFLRINKAMVCAQKSSSSVREMEKSTIAWNTVFSGPREPGNKEQWEDRKRSNGFCYGGDGERESEETLRSGDILIGS